MTLDLFDTTIDSEKLILRDYQQSDLEAVIHATESHNRIMYQLPTGGGKTKWAVQYAIEHVASQPGSVEVVVMSHRKEVQKQIQEDFRKFANHINREIVSPMRLYNRVKSAKRYRQWSYTENDLMIVDEAHHSPAKSWQRPIEEFPGKVIGITATPWRLSRTEGFDHLWDYLHCGPQIQWLVDNGHLAPLKLKKPPSRDAMRGRGNAQGDFSMKESYEDLNQHQHINDHAIDWLLKHALIHQKKSIVFCMTVEHAHDVAAKLTDRGYPAATIDAKTPEAERDQIIEDFKDGILLSLVNVFIASEGFDVPTAEIVAIFRPTKSLAMYLQMAGRGTRMAGGKEYGLILDVAMNADLFGHPMENRTWSLAPRGFEKEDAKAPVKRCDYCSHISPAGARKCYSCEEPFGKECPGCKTWRAWKWYADDEGKCYDCEYDSSTAFKLADQEEGNGPSLSDHGITRDMSQEDKDDHRALIEADFQRKKSGSYQRYFNTVQITIMASFYDDTFGYILRCIRTGKKEQKWKFPSRRAALNGIRRRMFPNAMRKKRI